MNRKGFVVSLMLLLFIPQWGSAADQRSLRNEQERLGYALGHRIGLSLKALAEVLDVDKFVLGVKDAYSGTQSLVSVQEAERYQRQYRFDENNNLVPTSPQQNTAVASSPSPGTSESNAHHQDPQGDAGIINLDLYDLKFDTLEQGGYSFYNLYTNAITPGSTDKDIEKICEALAVPQFASECRGLLAFRLTYLLKEDITEARFVGARPEMKSDQNLVVVTWQEHLTRTGDKKTTTKRKMSIWLKQENKRWKATKVQVD